MRRQMSHTSVRTDATKTASPANTPQQQIQSRLFWIVCIITEILEYLLNSKYVL